MPTRTRKKCAFHRSHVRFEEPRRLKLQMLKKKMLAIKMSEE